MFNSEQVDVRRGERILGVGRKQGRRDRRDLRRAGQRLARTQTSPSRLAPVLRRGRGQRLRRHGGGGGRISGIGDRRRPPGPGRITAAATCRGWCRGSARRILRPMAGRLVFGYVTSKHADRGMPASYGHRNVGRSVSYPGTPWLDLAIAYAAPPSLRRHLEFPDEDFRVIEGDAGPGHIGFAVSAPPTVLEHRVTKISSDGVFQGSSNLS